MKKQIDGQLNFLNMPEEGRFVKEYPQFMECNDCWCYDCKYNENNEAVQRDFAGVQKSCPSCSFCVGQNRAEICKKGSYKEGCRVRSEEEGIEV